MASTLLLDTVAWDLVLDVNGNIALATEPYSLAQDAASYIQTFQGELYYDTTVGIPYFGQVLGRAPALSVLKTLFVNQAELVPDVGTAQCFISAFTNRKISGQVQITESTTGLISPPAAASFTVINPQGV